MDLGEPDLPGQESRVGMRRAHAHEHVGVGQAAVRLEVEQWQQWGTG